MHNNVSMIEIRTQKEKLFANKYDYVKTVDARSSHLGFCALRL